MSTFTFLYNKYHAFFRYFGYSSADGVNVCVCGNYGGLFDGYVSSLSTQTAESLTNNILWTHISTFINFNGDFFRCSTDCNNQDAFIVGYYEQLDTHGSRTAAALETSYNQKEATIKSKWENVHALAESIRLSTSSDYCTLG